MTMTAAHAPSSSVPTASASPSGAGRIQSIDLLRGLVMVIMALDHIRDFSGVPASGPTAAIFFTRWITHFAAPAFSFFAGTAIFFNARKINDPRALTRFLLERGALLVLLDLTVVRASWTFNFDYAHHIAFTVIWMLGWSMIMMAGLVRFPARPVGYFGLAVIFGQQAIGLVHGALPEAIRTATDPFWRTLYFGGPFHYGAEGIIFVRYSLVPWIGVMAAGYGFGTLLLGDARRRDRLCLEIGLAATGLFVLIAGVQTLMRTPPPEGLPLLFQFLGQRKYPASELFLLMTLGPTIALIPMAERMRGWLADTLVSFGRTPMFFYLLHLPLIHATALGVSYLRTGRVDPWLFTNLFSGAPPVPHGYAWGLPLVYAVWALLIVVLRFACRWYEGVKSRHRDGVLRYL